MRTKLSLGFRRLLRGGLIALAGTAILSAQATKPPAPAQVKPPTAAPVKPAPDKPAPDKPATDKPATDKPPTLTKVTVVFRTDGSAKPPAAPVSIYLLRKDGFVAAMKQSVGGDFGAEKSVDLEIFGAPVKADLTKLRISFKPPAEARWRFNCTVFLQWRDTTSPVVFEDILMTDRNAAFEAALGGS